MLGHPSRIHSLFHAENVAEAELLNLALADARSRKEVVNLFVKQTIVDAFAGEAEFSVPVDGSNDVIYVKKYRQMEGGSKKRKMVIGWFSSFEDGRNATKKDEVPDPGILPAAEKKASSIFFS